MQTRMLLTCIVVLPVLKVPFNPGYYPVDDAMKGYAPEEVPTYH